MTLVVAATSGSEVWMVGDTAMTSPKLSVRDTILAPKIYRLDARSLFGFAGDPDLAERIARRASKREAGAGALDEICKRQREYPSVDVAYAFMDAARARLFKIADRKCKEVSTLHLGSEHAFRRFQEFRLSSSIDHAPDAIHRYMASMSNRATGPYESMDQIKRAVISLWMTIAASKENYVGGCVLPWTLSDAWGAELLSYSYSVTGPIVDQLKTGDLIRHGSASEGAFGFSLTRVGYDGDMTAYFLQRPGGEILRYADGKYQSHSFKGPPTSFKAQVLDALGRTAELYFGDVDSTAAIIATESFTDDSGQERVRIHTREDRTISYEWVQGSSDSWRISGSLRKIPS